MLTCLQKGADPLIISPPGPLNIRANPPAVLIYFFFGFQPDAFWGFKGLFAQRIHGRWRQNGTRNTQCIGKLSETHIRARGELEWTYTNCKTWAGHVSMLFFAVVNSADERAADPASNSLPTNDLVMFHILPCQRNHAFLMYKFAYISTHTYLYLNNTCVYVCI